MKKLNKKLDITMALGLTLCSVGGIPALATIPVLISEQNLTELYPDITSNLAMQYMIDDVQLIRGDSPESLDLVKYHEAGPTRVLVVGETAEYLYVYMENCDICALMARAHKATSQIETLRQSHELTCKDIEEELTTRGVRKTLCTL